MNFVIEYNHRTGDERDMSIAFHNTGYGRRFFERQLPDLIEAINRVADSQQKSNDLLQEHMQLTRENLAFQQEQAKVNTHYEKLLAEQNEMITQQLVHIQKNVDQHHEIIKNMVDEHIASVIGHGKA